MSRPGPVAALNRPAGVLRLHPNALRMAQVIQELNSGNPHAIVDLLDEDVVWHAAGDNPYSGERRGRTACAHWFAEVASMVAGHWVVEPVGLLADDRYVVFLLHVRGSRNGLELEQTHVNAWRFEGDRCVEGWFLPDRTDAWDAFAS